MKLVGVQYDAASLECKNVKDTNLSEKSDRTNVK
jgi:hypothetical protein